MAEKSTKGSVHGQRGGYSLRHNDGSLYGHDDEAHKAGRVGNTHYFRSSDPGVVVEEHKGANAGRTVREVGDWYEKHLGEAYDAACQSEGWKRNPSRRKSWPEFCDMKKNQLNEWIYQVGDMDSPDKQLMRTATEIGWLAVRQWQEGINRRAEAQGVDARIDWVCADGHWDEATPHIHSLEALVASDGTLNTDKALKELGFEKAQPPRKKGESKKRYEKRCTRIATYTAEMRQVFEDAVDGYFKQQGLDLRLDRERSDRKGSGLKDFKEQMAKLDAYKEELDEREQALAANELKLEEREQDLSEALRAAEVAEARFDDLREQVEHERSWWESFREAVYGALADAANPMGAHIAKRQSRGQKPAQVVSIVYGMVMDIMEAMDKGTAPELADVSGVADAVRSLERAQQALETPTWQREVAHSAGRVARNARDDNEGPGF